MKISVFRKTDLGRKRLRNEDNFVILNSKQSEVAPGEMVNPWENISPGAGGLFLCAIDGMGGTAGGQLASQTVAEFIKKNWNTLKSERSEILPVVALEKANEALREVILANPNLSKMGAVATCCYIFRAYVYAAQVGDSRLYLLRDSKLTQLSEDQTLVSNLVRFGKITLREAETHPQKNVVSQALGPMANLKPVPFKFQIKAGDKVLLCSDGLHGLITKAEIQKILTECTGENALNRLIHQANENGGNDNITGILAEIYR